MNTIYELYTMLQAYLYVREESNQNLETYRYRNALAEFKSILSLHIMHNKNLSIKTYLKNTEIENIYLVGFFLSTDKQSFSKKFFTVLEKCTNKRLEEIELLSNVLQITNDLDKEKLLKQLSICRKIKFSNKDEQPTLERHVAKRQTFIYPLEKNINELVELEVIYEVICDKHNEKNEFHTYIENTKKALIKLINTKEHCYETKGRVVAVREDADKKP